MLDKRKLVWDKRRFRIFWSLQCGHKHFTWTHNQQKSSKYLSRCFVQRTGASGDAKRRQSVIESDSESSDNRSEELTKIQNTSGVDSTGQNGTKRKVIAIRKRTNNDASAGKSELGDCDSRKPKSKERFKEETYRGRKHLSWWKQHWRCEKKTSHKRQ